MERYLRLFLCGAKSVEIGEILTFTEWVAAGLHVSQGASVAARKIGDLQLKPSIKGEYIKCKNIIQRAQLQSLDVTWGEWTEAGVALFLHVETQPAIVPDRAGSSSQYGSSTSILPSCFTLVVLSVRSDLWAHCDEQFIASCFQRIDWLFVALDCKYGSLDEAQHPSLSSYSLLTTNEQPAMRVIDFDFASHIDDIRLHNYLSSGHTGLLKSGWSANDFLDFADFVELLDQNGVTKAARISLKDTSPRTIGLAKELLRPLLA